MRNHLTYCTNIHGGETWADTFSDLKLYLPKVKEQVSISTSFPVGLRLSAIAAVELLDGNNLQNFSEWLSENGFYVCCINGFPYGNFHYEVIKDKVHSPDWQTDARVEYTKNLIKILAFLLPKGTKGSISTSPLSYAPWHRLEDINNVINVSTLNILKVAEVLFWLRTNHGVHISLDVEPEPDGIIEDATTFINWYQNSLLELAKPAFKVNERYNEINVVSLIADHIGVCYDVCHFAVLYLNQHDCINQLINAGIKIGRVQLSAALHIDLPNTAVARTAAVSELELIADPIYLHQVAALKKSGEIIRFVDMPEAIKALSNLEIQSIRTHFHVPLFHNVFGIMQSTCSEVIEAINMLIYNNLTSIYEIETYTWQVLPKGLKTDLVESIVSEIDWANNNMKRGLGN